MNPIVSVCVFTYNHEKYIKQCIESALMQNTKFDFEIVIGEDYSTDHTRQICSEYALKYPIQIRLLDRGKNLGMCENIFDSIKQCKGKYIAILDGDDYWIHPFKLQMQFEYLEANKEMNLVFHQSIKLNEVLNSISFFKKYGKLRYSIFEIIDSWIMATGSMFFRAEAMDYPDFLSHTHNFDLIIQLILNRDGQETGFINEIMSVYRINADSNTYNSNYNTFNTLRRKKLLFEEFNNYSNLRFDDKIKLKLKEIGLLQKSHGKFSITLVIKNKIKKIFSFFGFELVTFNSHSSNIIS